MSERYDLVVVGSGPAGEKAAALAAYHGRRVAVVERSPRPGGTMAAGVAATKTMREAALYLTGFRRREVYGVGLHLDPELAVQGVRDRARAVESVLSDSVAANLERHGVALLRGQARLLDATTIEVRTTADSEPMVVTAAAVLLAPGSRPFHPPGIPFGHPDVLDSDTARELDRPYRHVVVVGGGAVACEYASIFAALGGEVTLVESGSQLLAFMDAEIAALLAQAFRDMGVHVVLGAGHAKVATDVEGVCVELGDGTRLRPTKVIVAAGRVGNIEDLGLDQLGIETDGRGHIRVDASFATNVAGVYAAGDVTGPPALASVSMEQGRLAASAAIGVAPRRVGDYQPPFGVYAIPEAAMVGLTEAAAIAAGLPVAVGRARLARNARTTITGGSSGLVKLVFRSDDRRLLGAHILGDNATELVHLPQAVLHFGGTIDYFIDAAVNTPTATEAFKFAAYDGLSRLEHRDTLTVSV